ELSGTTNWSAGDAQIALGPGTGGQLGRCCGPSTICVPTGDGGGGPEPCEFSFCGTDRISISQITPPPLRDRQNAGRPIVGGSLYNEPSPAGTPVPGAPPTGAFGDFGLDCVEVQDPTCLHVKPICDLGDIGYTTGDDGTGDQGSGSNPCGGR